MKKKYLFFIVFLLFFSCNNKENFISRIEIGDEIYREKYELYSGGVYANNSYSYYVTDLVSFRKHVGTIYYDDERLFCESIENKMIKVFTVSFSSKDTFDIKYYSIEKLKKEGKFE